MAAGILFPGEQKPAEHPEGGGQRNARLQLLPRHPFIPFDRLGEFGQIPLHLPLQMGENMPGGNHPFNRRLRRDPQLRQAGHFERPFQRRELPQSGEQPLRRAFPERDALPAAQQKHTAPLDSARLLRRPHRNLRRRSGPPPFTQLRQRAARTLRRAVRQTDHRTQLHQALGEVATASGRVDSTEFPGDLLAETRLRDLP